MVSVVVTGSHGGGALSNVADVKSWAVWRAMQAGSCGVKLNHFTSDNYKVGCDSTYRNLPTRFRLGLRNKAGTQVGAVEFTKNEFGVTKYISISPSGAYAVNSRFLFDNGAMYGTAQPGQNCYEEYASVDFSVTLIFNPYLG